RAVARYAQVAPAPANAGAAIRNGVSAFPYDPQSAAVAAETRLSVILMHAQGEPKTMHLNPVYTDVVLEVFDYLEQCIEAAEAAGISHAKIAADPGVGFGKTMAHTLRLLANLSLFHALGVPLLVGASRKRFIAGISGADQRKSREPGSLAVAISAASQGIQILRVHDVAGRRPGVAAWRGAPVGH